MRYNKEETRKALIYECSRSTSNREIKKYALEFEEDLNDGEYFKNPTLKNVRKLKYDRNRTLQSINARKSRSAWGRAVNEYACELAERIEDGKEFKDINSIAIELLNGACDWCKYSEGGCSLISDYEIAERLCPPSKFKKKKYGELPPYRGMSWIALQGRALCAASYVVKSHLKIKKHESEI